MLFRKGSIAARIVEFALSPAAQEIIRAHGFIDQNIELSDQNEQVLRLADGLIALDSRRRHGCPLKELAVQAQIQLAPIDDAAIPAGFDAARQQGERGRRPHRGLRRGVGQIQSRQELSRLQGFTDSIGDVAANKALSQARAEQARESCCARIGPAIPKSMLVARGYGQLLPTNCNTTKEGRNRNRRVEIWVK